MKWSKVNNENTSFLVGWEADQKNIQRKERENWGVKGTKTVERRFLGNPSGKKQKKGKKEKERLDVRRGGEIHGTCGRKRGDREKPTESGS